MVNPPLHMPPLNPKISQTTSTLTKPPDLNHVSRLHHNPLPRLFKTLSAPTAN
jgi:hypothetical protein